MDVQKILLSFFTLLLLGIYGCSGGGGGSDVSSATIDASGGVVISSDNLAKLTVPPGAVSDPVGLTIDQANNLQDNFGIAYNFGPDGLNFSLPVIITIQYGDNDLPQDVSENELVLAEWNGSVWMPLASSWSEPVSNSVSGSTSHFSTYGIVLKQALPNTAPTVNNFSFSVVAGSTYNGVLTGDDADNDPLIYRFINTGAQGTATLADANAGTFSYVANTNASATDTLTYVTNDGESDSTIGTVTITFVTQLPPNTTPAVNDFSFSVVAGSIYNGVLAGNDADNDPLNYRFINTGSKGTATVTDANAGTFSYSADTNASGTDTLTYVANDGESDSTIGTITVSFTSQAENRLLWVTKTQWGSGVAVLTSPSIPGSISCGEDCFTHLIEGTQAVLLAIPTLGSFTAQWEGCDIVNGLECTVNMTSDRFVNVTFNTVTNVTMPQNDNNGIYALRWSCIIPTVCNGSYRIQETDNEDFNYYSEYSYVIPADPFLGARGFSDKADGVYCYRVSPLLSGSDANWSKPVCVVIDKLERASVGFNGSQANGNSYDVNISPYGHSVVFSSEATNLVSGDVEGYRDIFFRDSDGGSFFRASAISGAGGNGDSYLPVMTPDERYIAFFSHAGNLDYLDDNGGGDYFVYDRTTRNIERVSINNSGQSPFGGSFFPALGMSWNGRFVVFSTSSDLDAGTDDPNFATDVYVRDREYSYTSNISKGLNNTPTVRDASNPVISGGTGFYIAYESYADNLVANDNNNTSDIFLYNMWTSNIVLVSTNASGGQANGESHNPSISADGRYVAFDSLATNLISGDTNNQRDVFVKDMLTGEVKRVSENEGVEGNGWSYYPKISAKGDHIAFQSSATNLSQYDVNNADDIFIKYFPSDTLIVVNTANRSSSQANDYSGGPAISAEGMYVGFMSSADNLLRFLSTIDVFSYNDSNEASDVFVYSNKNSIMSPSTEDSDDDADGLTNIYELTVSFTLPFNIDTDGDGFSDKVEVDAQTDPLNPNVYP